MLLKEKENDDDVFLIENSLIPIMMSYIEDKKALRAFNNTTVESWLTSLLKVGLLGNTMYFNIGRYIPVILDDIDKCVFFTEHKNRTEIIKFLSTLII